jgi:hypothetical protein
LKNFSRNFSSRANADASKNPRNNIAGNNIRPNPKDAAKSERDAINNTFRQRLGNSSQSRTALIDWLVRVRLQLTLTVSPKEQRQTSSSAAKHTTNNGADARDNATKRSTSCSASKARGHGWKAHPKGLPGSTHVLTDALRLFKRHALAIRKRLLSFLFVTNPPLTTEALQSPNAGYIAATLNG